MATSIEELKNQLFIAEENYKKSLGVLPVVKEIGKTIGGGIETVLPGIKAIRESIQQKSLEPEKKFLKETFRKTFIQPGDTTEEIAQKAIQTGMGMGLTAPEVKIADTALSKLINAIKTAKPLRGKISAMQSAERSARVGKASAILEKGVGESAFIKAKGSLRGPLLSETPPIRL